MEYANGHRNACNVVRTNGERTRRDATPACARSQFSPASAQPEEASGYPRERRCRQPADADPGARRQGQQGSVRHVEPPALGDAAGVLAPAATARAVPLSESATRQATVADGHLSRRAPGGAPGRAAQASESPCAAALLHGEGVVTCSVHHRDDACTSPPPAWPRWRTARPALRAVSPSCARCPS